MLLVAVDRKAFGGWLLYFEQVHGSSFVAGAHPSPKLQFNLLHPGQVNEGGGGMSGEAAG